MWPVSRQGPQDTQFTEAIKSTPMRGDQYHHDKWWCLHSVGAEDEAVTELGLLISLRVMDPEVIKGPVGLVLSYQKPRGRNYCNN